VSADGPQALGFVLAGGRSRRMGRDKALLAWGHTTLLAHAIARLKPLCAEIFLLSGTEARYAETGLAALTDVERDA
jgi:molybdopterin-guanine dinucleotide biosynthesis protein A